MIHGSHNTYSRHGCRCAPCTAANAAEQMRKRRLKGVQPFRSWRHGKASSYVRKGCRCDACVAAYRMNAREAKRRYRARKAAA